MPKRGCPFGDASPLQLKVHVGPRELSRGVFAERCSREVFGECGGSVAERTAPHGAAGDPNWLARREPGGGEVEAASCRSRGNPSQAECCRAV